MGFTAAIRSGFDHYVKFDGRASRSAYWWWALFVFIIVGIVANVLDGVFGLQQFREFNGQMYAAGGVISGIATLALLLPNLSVTIRRLHDTDRSGWWWFIVIFPVIGWIIYLYFMIARGTPGPNRFGPPTP